MKTLLFKLNRIWILFLLGVLAPINSYAQITNPLGGEGSATTIGEVIINITKWLLGLVALLAMLALVVGGLRIILAFGKEDSLRSGKQIVLWAIIGLVVTGLSVAIILLVQNFLGVSS